MPRRKKYPRLPNGYGSIKKLSGKNRTNPYGVYPPVKEFTEDGLPVMPKALCYVDDWYKGFTVLTWYRNGEYYEGREKELSKNEEELKKQVIGVLSKFNQSQRELADQKTFTDIFKEFYYHKFKKEYNLNKEKRSSSENSFRAAYKNCSALHDKSFRSLTASDLQAVVDGCTLKHSSIELIIGLFKGMYAYADANNLCDKDYSQYVKINISDDDEHGVPFSEEELSILWNNRDNETVELILIMCYSGFRISAYQTLEINLEEKYFFGGIKTAASKNRYVPIHPCILELVKKRLDKTGSMLPITPGKFRLRMKKVLSDLGLEEHTPHDCRHTFSMLCEKYKVNENDRKRMLGHSFQDVTNKVYGHRDIEDLRIEIEKIKICY